MPPEGGYSSGAKRPRNCGESRRSRPFVLNPEDWGEAPKNYEIEPNLGKKGHLTGGVGAKRPHTEQQLADEPEKSGEAEISAEVLKMGRN